MLLGSLLRVSSLSWGLTSIRARGPRSALVQHASHAVAEAAPEACHPALHVQKKGLLGDVPATSSTNVDMAVGTLEAEKWLSSWAILPGEYGGPAP